MNSLLTSESLTDLFDFRTNTKKSESMSYSTCFHFRKWALTDSNRRPSACKADALNQLLTPSEKFSKREPYFIIDFVKEWALTDSNRRPSACKADALNQLS